MTETAVNLFKVRRPGGTGITARTSGQLSLVFAARVHHEELLAAAARRAEDQIAAIGGPRRIDVVATSGGELQRLAAARAHDEDLERATDAPDVRDPITLGRPGG